MTWGGQGSPQNGSERREAREAMVRLVEYCPFPRTSASEGWRRGSTRNLSPSGMCLGVDEVYPEGSLLRITLLGIDGRPTLATLARVAWSRQEDGGPVAGLALLGGTATARTRVRPVRPVRAVSEPEAA